MLPRTVVDARAGWIALLHLAVPEGLPLRWEIWSEQKIADGEGSFPVLHLPQGLPHGVFRLHVTSRGCRQVLLTDVGMPGRLPGSCLSRW